MYNTEFSLSPAFLFALCRCQGLRCLTLSVCRTKICPVHPLCCSLAATFTSHLAGKITAAPSVNSSAVIALADPHQVTNPSSLWHHRSHYGSLTNTCSLLPTLCLPCEDQVEFPMGSSRAIPKILEFAPYPLLCCSPLINNMTPFLRGL